ncbi:MAG: Na+/H+ antiporter NhaC family protein [Akkermansiaceae bacterium]
MSHTLHVREEESMSQEGAATYFRVGILAAVLIVTWIASFSDFSGKALWPAAIAFATILLTRHAMLGLFSGALAGCLFLVNGDLWLAMRQLLADHFFPSMQGPWRVGAILFTLILGAFTVVIEKSGGFEAVAKRLIGKDGGDEKRRLETATGLMGLLCFFDGLANSLLLGRITQPLADRAGVARARMAYLVDSTSSSIACVAFISTWIATQLSLIQQSIEGRGIDDSAYGLFFQSIGQNFYCLFTLALVVVVIWRRWNIGPMRNAKPTAPAALPSDEGPAPSIWVALTPIIVLAASIVALFYLWETSPVFPVTGEKLATAFSGSAGPYALTLGSVVGLMVAWVMFPRKKSHTVPRAMREGAAGMLAPLLILIMAWTFGSVMKELGTAKWLADAIGSKFSPSYFPAAVFLTGSCISFLTGSSWGTMALLMPLAIPGYLDVAGDSPVMLPAVIGAVFSGAVFGDHCSPFSDTTVVSAFACGVSPREHVITQLPYALLAAAVALGIGYLGIGAGVHPLFCLVLGVLVLAGLGYLQTQKQARE